jgi:hypothetical protein
MSSGNVILVFSSNADAMIATKVLKDAGIPAKMIPKPSGVDSQANLCLSIEGSYEPHATLTLSGRGVRCGSVAQ